MQVASVALNAHGYRTLTSKPGHHRTAIQTLLLTVGPSSRQIIVPDAMRKQRNLSDYAGDLVPEALVAGCLSNAASLRIHVQTWLQTNKPELL